MKRQSEHSHGHVVFHLFPPHPARIPSLIASLLRSVPDQIIERHSVFQFACETVRLPGGQSEQPAYIPLFLRERKYFFDKFFLYVYGRFYHFLEVGVSYALVPV